MPGQDQTGPLGQGPMTGRGMGFCGKGFRRGFGRGFRRFQNFELSDDQEKKVLEAELAEIDAEKAEIEKRLKSLKE